MYIHPLHRTNHSSQHSSAERPSKFTARAIPKSVAGKIPRPSKSPQSLRERCTDITRAHPDRKILASLFKRAA